MESLLGNKCDIVSVRWYWCCNRELIVEERALTWHKTLAQKLMCGYYGSCIPSPPSVRKKLKNRESRLSICDVSGTFSVTGLEFLTILKHADKSDDDQEVDIFHHFVGVHDYPVSFRSRCLLGWKTQRLSFTSKQAYLKSVANHKPDLSRCDIMLSHPTSIPHTHLFVASPLCKWCSGLIQRAANNFAATSSVCLCKTGLHVKAWLDVLQNYLHHYYAMCHLSLLPVIIYMSSVMNRHLKYFWQ